MFLSLIGMLVGLIILLVLFSLFLPVFLIFLVVLIITRTDLTNGIIIAAVIAFAGYLVTDDVLSLTNIIMFPIIVYVYKRIEPSVFHEPMFRANNIIHVDNLVKLFVVSVVFIGLGSLFSSMLSSVFSASILLGFLLIIPIFLLFGLISHFVIVVVIVPLMSMIESMF
jgi:hypothetical protein